MHSLELQTAVQPIEPDGALHIHCGAELALGERLCGAEVGGRHAPVGEGDLDVQEHGDAVGDQDERDAYRPAGEGAPNEAIPEEEPVRQHCHDFDRTRPARGAEVGGAWRDEVAPGEEVEVEAGEGHDGVVGVLLDADCDLGDGVPDEFEAAVVG